MHLVVEIELINKIYFDRVIHHHKWCDNSQGSHFFETSVMDVFREKMY